MLQVGKVIKDFKKAGFEAEIPFETGIIHFVKDGSKEIVYNPVFSDELYGVAGKVADSIDEAIDLAGGVA